MRTYLAMIGAIGLAGCGGGGGGSNPTPATPAGNPGGVLQTSSGIPVSYSAGSYLPASSFKSQCMTPRTGTNPLTNQPYSDISGSTATENAWLRSWTNETYLWFSEVPDLNPNSYGNGAYFPLLKTAAVTTSGLPKDRFHFTYPTTQWIALSQSGVESGYGAQWLLVSLVVPRRVVVAYVEPNSPAANAGLTRGDEVITVDGWDLVNGGYNDYLEAMDGIFPANNNENHTLTLRPVTGPQRTVTLQSRTDIVTTPVPRTDVIQTGTGPVGYLVFNDHIATSEAQLIAAINQLKTANVTDLILDVRYNGGGYLDIASELAYMIAGPVPTAGRTFERLTFNSKHPNTNPVTGQALAPVPFHTTTQGFSAGNGAALPTLNLSRVFVITGSGTCSASESIINSLRGVDVQVNQIGMTTCGKPYGFYATDNCGTTYFTIQFKGVNAKNFGDYTDGFTPINSVAGRIGERLPGCSVNDDFTRPLGDPAEGKLAAALQYRDTGTCPVPPTSNPIGFAKTSGMEADGYLLRPQAKEIRVMRSEDQQ